MHVLLTGADGLIGRALAEALLDAGHTLTLCMRDAARGARDWPGQQVIAVDLSTDLEPEHWRERLQGVDAVINAAGIFRESGRNTFEAVHSRAPRALFRACLQAGVRRVVQISALGAAPDAVSAFQRSKAEADLALAALPLLGTVVRPSLVFAPHGRSAAMFLQLACLPWIPIPGRGGQCVQPVHLDDLVALVLRVIVAPAPPAVVDAVGPRAMRLREYLGLLRAQMGLGAPAFVRVPLKLVGAAARVAVRWRGALLDPSALAMLERGSFAPPTGMLALLGRPARDPARFLSPGEAASARQRAQLATALPLLRWSLAVVWIVTGVLSLGVFDTADSLQLLQRAGIPAVAGPAALYTAGVLDLVLGVAMLLPWQRRRVYLAQAVVMLAYTVVITVRLPEFWLHPFGPVLKNLPILAALWMLYAFDGEPRPASPARKDKP